MKKIILILLLFLGYNSNAQQNQHTLPDLYIDFQPNLRFEPMYSAILNSGISIFMFESLLLGERRDLTEGIALEMTQIEGTIPVTIPLANLATYMAGRPLLNTVQIRQEYSTLTSDLQRVSYFDDEQKDIFVVEKNTQNQTAKITQVWWTNGTF